MIVIACVDDKMGMLFNHRRQSQDSVLRKRILQITAGKILWMSRYSKKQFYNNNAPQIIVDDEFLLKAAPDDFCFVETESLKILENHIKELIIYRWNRVYPSDLKFDIDLNNWTLRETFEFQGSSHDKITEEVYTK